MKDIMNLSKKRVQKDAIAALWVCVLWGIGLLIGRHLADNTGTASILLIRIAAGKAPVLLIQILGQLLPLALTFVIVRYFCQKAMAPVIVLDALAFGYASCLCIQAFRSAGWLVYRILYFAECISAAVLIWVWLRIAKDRRYLTIRRLLCFSGILCIVVLFDYFVCTKFLLFVLT